MVKWERYRVRSILHAPSTKFPDNFNRNFISSTVYVEISIPIARTRNKKWTIVDSTKGCGKMLEMSVLIPILLFDAEAWTRTTCDESALGISERKVLHKICGPLRVS